MRVSWKRCNQRQLTISKKSKCEWRGWPWHLKRLKPTWYRDGAGPTVSIRSTSYWRTRMWDQVKQALYQSTTRFFTGLASLLPGVVAVVVALLISIIVAWILTLVLRRVLA